MPASSPVPNLWPSDSCAKAFWGQQDCRPYKQLLADTLAWAGPAGGEHWLDLGCGGGAVSRAVWDRTAGAVGSVVGVDCAAVNERAYRQHRSAVGAAADRLRFVHHDFSNGLGVFADGRFDHAVSGLSVSYAEHFDAAAGRWTPRAYEALLREVRRVLRPGGRFVFSVNVPEPSWGRVAWHSLPGLLRTDSPLQTFKRAARMMQYGRWLKREARVGRFHYMPAAEVSARLVTAGFTAVEHRLSYCDQAYIFRAVSPA